jgi:hypothetical protein
MNACRDAKLWPASVCIISFWVHHDISTLKDRANKASSDLDLNITIFLEVESKEQIGILLQIPKHQIELFSLSLSLLSITFFVAKPKKGRKFNS